MAETSSILALEAGIRAFFAKQNPSVSVGVTGWKARFQHLNQGSPVANRVCLIPGDPNGADGALTRGRQTSANPRNLLEWDRKVTVSVWAFDSANAADDRAQIVALENLLAQTLQALHRAVDPDTGALVGVANIHWGSIRWTVDNKEMGAGREVLVDLILKSTFFDLPNGVAFPGQTLNRTPST